MSPPEWALLERELLDASGEAVSDFYDHFFDERGYLLHVARWGALDGTDDASISILKKDITNSCFL